MFSIISIAWKFKNVIGIILGVLSILGLYLWFMSVLDEREKLRNLVADQKVVIEAQSIQIEKEREAFRLADEINSKLEKEIKELEESDLEKIDSITSDDIDNPAPNSVKEFLEKSK